MRNRRRKNNPINEKQKVTNLAYRERYALHKFK